jgi:hypothetical protein
LGYRKQKFDVSWATGRTGPLWCVVGREFTHNVAHGAIVHVLAQARSDYPSIDLKRVTSGRARGTSDQQIATLEDEAGGPAKRLAKDVEFCSQRHAG